MCGVYHVCGVPCVVTDVGDSALVVGETGKVVPAKDSKALSSAWHEMLLLNDEAIMSLSVSARKRVMNEFSVKALLDKTGMIMSQGTS